MEEIVDFLIRLRDELLEKRDVYAKELNDIDVHVREDSKFLEFLRGETDKSFNEFSPRDYNYKNESKIQELEKTYDAEVKRKKFLTDEIDDIDSKCSEIDSLLDKLNENK